MYRLCLHNIKKSTDEKKYKKKNIIKHERCSLQQNTQHYNLKQFNVILKCAWMLGCN